MKTFKDLVFDNKFKKESIDAMKDEGLGIGYSTAKHSRITFDNGYSVSVITGFGAFADDSAPYELAILNLTGLDYTTGITDDVMGYQTEKDITKTMIKVQELPSIKETP